MVRIGMDGTVRDASAPKPSSEWPFHTQTMIKKPGANAVIHAHAPYATILANTGLPFLPISTEAAFFVAAERTRRIEFVERVRPDDARADLPGHLENLRAFIGPHAAGQTVRSVVGLFHRFVLGAERENREYRAENLVLSERARRRDVVEDRRRDVVAVVSRPRQPLASQGAAGHQHAVAAVRNCERGGRVEPDIHVPEISRGDVAGLHRAVNPTDRVLGHAHCTCPRGRTHIAQGDIPIGAANRH